MTGAANVERQVLLKWKAVAKEFLDRVFNEKTLRRQFFNMNELVGAFAVSETDVQHSNNERAATTNIVTPSISHRTSRLPNITRLSTPHRDMFC